MSVTYTVPKYSSTTKGAQQFNQPLVSIEQSLNALSNRIDGLANKSAVLQYQVALHPDTEAGDLVYFDAETSAFKPAIAKLSDRPGEQGQSVQAPESRVEGLVISLSPATILRSGYYVDGGLADSLLGAGAEAGMYFLSPTDRGKATKDPGWNMRQPVLSYYGDGGFALFANYLAHDNHHHASTEIERWANVSASDSISSSLDVKYKFTPNPSVGQLDPDVTAVFIDGKLQMPGKDYVISNGSLYVGSNSGVPPKNAVLFNHFPFAYGDSVVRSINSKTAEVKNKNGTVNIEFPDFVSGDISSTGLAVSDIQRNKLTLTPVVTSIEGGLGVSVAQGAAGKYRINLDTEEGAFRPAADVYLKGAQRTSQGMLAYTLFPSGVNAAVSFSLPVTFDKQTTKVHAKVAIVAKGTANLNCNLHFVPFDGSVAIPSVSTTYIGKVTATNSNSDVLVLAQSSNNLSISTSCGQGVLIAELQSSTNVDQYVYSVGFTLNKADSESSTSEQTLKDYVDTQIAGVGDTVAAQVLEQVQSQLEAYNTLSPEQDWGE